MSKAVIYLFGAANSAGVQRLLEVVVVDGGLESFFEVMMIHFDYYS